MAGWFANASLSIPVLVLAFVGWCVVPLAAASVLIDRRSHWGQPPLVKIWSDLPLALGAYL